MKVSSEADEGIFIFFAVFIQVCFYVGLKSILWCGCEAKFILFNEPSSTDLVIAVVLTLLSK